MLDKIDKALAVAFMLGLVLGAGYLFGRAFKNTPWYVAPAIGLGCLGLAKGKLQGNHLSNISDRLERDDWRDGHGS